jgi:hypothetical protein
LTATLGNAMNASFIFGIELKIFGL